MKYCISWCIAVCSVAATPFVSADIISLTVDATQSTCEITIAGSAPQQTSTSGTGVLELIPPTEPFGTAQILDLHVILDESLNFSFLGGLVTASTTGGDVMIDMVTPGAAGNVDAANQFDQLGNLLATTGTIDIVDPFNLVGGSQSFDLSTLAPSLVDFNGVMLSRVGNSVTIAADYFFTQEIDAGGAMITVDVTGTVVASGTVIPEPGAALPCALMILSGLVYCARRGWRPRGATP